MKSATTSCFTATLTSDQIAALRLTAIGRGKDVPRLIRTELERLGLVEISGYSLHDLYGVDRWSLTDRGREVLQGLSSGR
jgi:hypothetical protein